MSMDSVGKILQQKNIHEPDEVATIKSYIQTHFQSPASVIVRPSSIVISVDSASLANTIRLHTAALQNITHTDKKLVFRINS
jgi:hypothetical protein